MDKIEFTNRNLMEYHIERNLDTGLSSDEQEQISWLEANATACHKSDYEYFLWIPPYQNQEGIVKYVYGESIPQKIHDIILASIEIRKNEKDQGFLLIVYI